MFCAECYNLKYFNDKICSESLKCLKHCDFINHGHCAKNYCDKTTNLCEDTFKCKFHCVEMNHDHCCESTCENMDICEMFNCSAHCTKKNHNHCCIFMCKNQKVSNETFFCQGHLYCA